MTRLAMLLLLAPMVLDTQPIVALADDVPTFDVAATCRAESQDDPGAGIAATCMAQEQKARETLVSQWTQFAPQSRTNCTQEQFGATRSYVELLTCLQIAKEVKDLPK
jgi:hypothetical protein